MKDIADFEKAEKIKFEDYDGEMIFFNDSSIGNDGFLSTDEVEDFFYDTGRVLPEFAWTCDQLSLSIDTDYILESALEEHHEDAIYQISQKDIDELKSFLDNWCSKQNIRTFVPGKKAILFSEEFREKVK